MLATAKWVLRVRVIDVLIERTLHPSKTRSATLWCNG